MIRRFFPSGFRRHAPGLGVRACSPLAIGAVLMLAVPAGAAQQAGAVDDDTAEPAASTSIPVVQPTAPSPTRMLNAALARLARDPRDMGALLDAGGAALDLGDTDAAIGFLSRAEQVSPGNAGVRARIGIAMLRANQPFEAIRWFDLADQAGFNRAEMATERGLAYDLAGDNTAAQRQYQLAISGLPKESAQSDEAIRRYALSLVIAGDRRGAELLIQPLLERRDRGAWRVRTFIMAIAGQSDEAEGIARATMPADLAAAISPYLRYMPRLTPAQQAAAANLGRFPRAADIGRDDPQVVQYALAHPRAPRVDAGLVPQGEALGARGRDDRDSRAKRRRPGKDGARETAIAAAAPQTGTQPAPQAALHPATPPPPSAPAVSAPWGLQPGTRTAAAATQSAPQRAQTQPVSQPIPQAVQSARPTVLSKLDVPPGTPLAPSPVPTARAATPVSAPPAPLAAAPTAQASPPQVQTLQTSNPTPVPAPLAPAPSAPAAFPPAVSSTPAPVPAQVQVATTAGLAPGGASAALTAPPPAAPSVPVAAQPTPPSPVQAPVPAPVQAAATAPADFRSIFDGFKPPEQETAASTEAVDLARIEAMRQAARAEAAKSRADKGGERGKDRGERPDGPTAVSRTNGEDPAAARAARDKASKEAAAKEAEAKAASAKSAKDKLAFDRDCLDKTAKGKGASAKSSGTKGKASSKSAAAKGKGRGGSDTQCPPANDKSQKGKKAKAEAANPSRIWVQVLTGSNRSAMGKEWQRLTGQAAALRGRKPLISPWRNNFRLLTGPFGSDADAQAFVEKLRKEGVSGFQFTSPAGQAVDGLGAK